MVKAMREEKVDPMRSKATLRADGSEDHSNTGGQLAAALRIAHRDGLGDRVRELIRSERMAMHAEAQGMETFEEADDFDVPEDDSFDPQTPYEEVFEGSVTEDVKQRYAEQQAKLRQVQPEKLAEFLKGMDPAALDAAYRAVRGSKGPDPEPSNG